MYVWLLVIRVLFPDQSIEEFTLDAENKNQCLIRASLALELYEPKDFGAVSIEAGCRKEPESRES